MPHLSEIRRRDAQDAENFISIGRKLPGKVESRPRFFFLKKSQSKITQAPKFIEAGFAVPSTVDLDACPASQGANRLEWGESDTMVCSGDCSRSSHNGRAEFSFRMGPTLACIDGDLRRPRVDEVSAGRRIASCKHGATSYRVVRWPAAVWSRDTSEACHDLQHRGAMLDLQHGRLAPRRLHPSQSVVKHLHLPGFKCHLALVGGGCVSSAGVRRASRKEAIKQCKL